MLLLSFEGNGQSKRGETIEIKGGEMVIIITIGSCMSTHVDRYAGPFCKIKWCNDFLYKKKTIKGRGDYRNKEM